MILSKDIKKYDILFVEHGNFALIKDIKPKDNVLCYYMIVENLHNSEFLINKIITSNSLDNKLINDEYHRYDNAYKIIDPSTNYFNSFMMKCKEIILKDKLETLIDG